METKLQVVPPRSPACKELLPAARVIPEPQPCDIRAADAFDQRLHSRSFEGSDELRPPDAPRYRPNAADRKTLEAEAWYQQYLKLKAAR